MVPSPYLLRSPLCYFCSHGGALWCRWLLGARSVIGHRTVALRHRRYASAVWRKSDGALKRKTFPCAKTLSACARGERSGRSGGGWCARCCWRLQLRRVASRVLMAEDCAPTLRVHSSSSSSEERRGSGAQLSCRWRRGLELTERWSYKWDGRFGRSSAFSFVFFLFKRICLVMHLFSDVKISSRSSLSWRPEVSVRIWKALPPFF